MNDTFYTNCITMGNNICYRGYEEGERVRKNVPYKPTLFIPANKTSKYKTIDGLDVSKMSFDSINDAKDFVKQYRDVDNFKIFGNMNFHYCYISDNYSQQIEYNFDLLRVLFFDIETAYDSGFPEPEHAQEPVIAITIKFRNNFYVYGTKDYDSEYKNVFYFKCDDEKDLLQRFVDKWVELDPDIVSGWNVQFFDIPYLVNRITKILGEATAKKLAPFKSFLRRRVVLNGQEYECFELAGVACLDYIEMYRKFVGQAENYKLNTVAELILGESKLAYDGSLADLYKNDFKKFIEYNIQDVELVEKIDKKMQLISMVCAIAYDAKVNYTDVFTQVRLWDTIIFNYFKTKNWVLPQKKHNSKDTKYAGAFVKEPQIGMFNWVASFDLDSLYPHLIAQYNISPDTLVPEEYQTVSVEGLLAQQYDFSDLKQKNLTIAGNGHHFKVDKQGFLPEILMKMYTDRKFYKDKALSSKSELQKVEEEIKRRGL